MVASNNRSVTLTTYSLGSCLGVVLYDPVARVGGLLHAMLPDAALAPEKAAAYPAMFVNTGMDAVLEDLKYLGADRQRLAIAVAGGAHLLDDSKLFNIGERNLAALEEYCRTNRIRIGVAETGGQVNRTMNVRLADGEVRLRSSDRAEERVLCKSSMNTLMR